MPEDPVTVDVRRSLDWLRRGAYPLLLGVGIVTGALAVAMELDLEPALLAVFVGTMASLVLLERIIPYRRDWQPARGEVARDGVYVGLGFFFGGLGQLIASMVAIVIAPGDNGLPLWLGAPLAIVLADLGSYGFHRFVHANRWMWREHGIHHVTDKVNTLNANTTHFLDLVLNNIATLGPLLVLGFDAEAVFIATVVRVLQTLGLHANIDVRLGWLGHLIMGPEHHRLHHSVDRADAGNYATVLTLWDRVFGTLTWAPGRRVVAAGVQDPGAFPAPRRIVASALHPFVGRRPELDGSESTHRAS